MKILYLVVPCYNEEEVLNYSAVELKRKLESLIKSKKISSKSKILFVNDGSKDKTWQIIKELHKKDKIYSGISLSRNKGHQNALLAGLMYAKEKADITISLDADLQDDISVIEDTFFKRMTAELFYKLMLF